MLDSYTCILSSHIDKTYEEHWNSASDSDNIKIYIHKEREREKETLIILMPLKQHIK